MDRTFRTSTSTSLVRALAIGGVLLTGIEATGFGSTAFAAETPVAQDAAEADRVRMVGDFLHYVLIAKPDLAEAAGQKLFASGITDASGHFISCVSECTSFCSLVSFHINSC